MKKTLRTAKYSLENCAILRNTSVNIAVQAGKRRARCDRISESASPHIFLAAPGDGNMGDQAMLEAFLENSRGDILVIVRRTSAVDIPIWSRDRVEVIPLADLIYGKPLKRLRDMCTLARIGLGARSFCVAGADVMDGSYNVSASVARAMCARTMQSLGVPSRVLGFSWNKTSARQARDELRAAERSGVALCARDRISAERLLEAGIRTLLVSDTVFAASKIDRDDSRVLHFERAAGNYVLMNVSGLLQMRCDLTAEYLEIAEHLRSLELRVVLLPHVERDPDNDTSAIARVSSAMTEVGIEHEVLPLCPPSVTRALVKNAEFVITGRMHLAIISLSQAVPAIVLASQGKVEGLMRLFDQPAMCLQPVRGLAVQVEAAIDQVTIGDSAQRVRSALPNVSMLAAQNFPDREVNNV